MHGAGDRLHRSANREGGKAGRPVGPALEVPLWERAPLAGGQGGWLESCSLQRQTPGPSADFQKYGPRFRVV